MPANHKKTIKIDAHPANRWRRLTFFFVCICISLSLFTPTVAQAAAETHGCGTPYTYKFTSIKTCMKCCETCGYQSAGGHAWITNEKAATATKPATRETVCTQCGFSQGVVEYGSPDISQHKFSGHFQYVNSSEMFAFTKKIYNTVKSITIPLAIVSFASCGYHYLGAIFFGSYNAPRASEKTRKQVIWTVLIVLFIILLPKLLSFAEAFFMPKAWRPT